MGVCEEFERELDRVVEDWIKEKAWEGK